MRINQSRHARKAFVAILFSSVTGACGEGTPADPLPLGELREALTCTSWGSGYCDRPKVFVWTSFNSLLDMNGTLGAPVEGTRWYGISSCTANDCSIYSPKDATSPASKNKYYLVERSALKANSAGRYDGRTPEECMKARMMPTSTAEPSGFSYSSAHPADVDDDAVSGCAPNGASNTGITGAPDGAPVVIWGTDTVTGDPRSQTGFIGFPVFAGQRVIWTGYQEDRIWTNDSGWPICNPVNHWLVWTRSPRGDVWVMQWMVRSVYSLYWRGAWQMIY